MVLWTGTLLDCQCIAEYLTNLFEIDTESQFMVASGGGLILLLNKEIEIEIQKRSKANPPKIFAQPVSRTPEKVAKSAVRDVLSN